MEADLGINSRGDLNSFGRGVLGKRASDNRSATLKKMLDTWGVRCFFRAAYRPSGNGIVERHHQTVKVLAERSGISPQEAVFWYNLTPKTGQKVDSMPQNAIFKYEWQHPCDVPQPLNKEKLQCKLEIKCRGSHRCMTQRGRGVVTEMNSKNNVSINGFPCHILDLRQVNVIDEEEKPSDDEAPRRSLRERHPLI